MSVRGPSFGRTYDLFWMHGRYTGWLDFGTSIRTRLRQRAGRPPNAAFSVSRGRDRRTFVFRAATEAGTCGGSAMGTAPIARGRRITYTYRRKGRYRVVSTAFRHGRRDVFVREVRVRR